MLSTLICVLLGVFSLLILTPSYESIKKNHQGSDAYFYDRSDRLIHVARRDMTRRQMLWVDERDVAVSFVQTLIAAEDKRFWYHPGFDPVGLMRAAMKSDYVGQQGASTLTMQLVSKIYTPLRNVRSRVPIIGKILQIVAATGLELKWSKREILTTYLNIVPFRGEYIGISSAAYFLFGKHPNALSDHESTWLVAMLRSPNSSSEKIARRACQMTSVQQADTSAEACARYYASILEHSFDHTLIHSRSGQDKRLQMPDLLPHLAKRILANRALDGVVEIKTTIDSALQRYVSDAIANRLSQTIRQNAHDAAVIVVDNQSREILAYVGGSGQLSTAMHVDGAAALRQAGSTLKPFFYARALEERIITAATVLDDAPSESAVAAGGVYQPRNFDERFRGSVSVRDALASSLNIPAVKVVDMLGVDPSLEVLRDLGMTQIRENEFYGPSIALGAVDVSLYDLAQAYVALANQGRFAAIKFLKNQADPANERPVFSPETAFIIRSILSDNVARAPTFGLDSALFTAIDTAVKTGTSKDMRDNWCVGFSDRYTVAVWVGNFSGASMWNLTGIAGAAPIWSDVMHVLHRDVSSQFSKPEDLGVVAKKISFSFKRGAIEEWFIKGTEPQDEHLHIEEIKKTYDHRILYPTHDSILAVDPDIPSANQMVLFSASNSENRAFWLLNGRRLGHSREKIAWTPQKGKYELSLVDEHSGRVLDRVDFLVR